MRAPEESAQPGHLPQFIDTYQDNPERNSDEGMGNSKKEAEQKAARVALEKLRITDNFYAFSKRISSKTFY